MEYSRNQFYLGVADWARKKESTEFRDERIMPINELIYLTATNEANTRAPEFIIGL